MDTEGLKSPATDASGHACPPVSGHLHTFPASSDAFETSCKPGTLPISDVIDFPVGHSYPPHRSRDSLKFGVTR